MAEPRIVSIEDIRREIREYGISRLARQLGVSRSYVQRICGGQRQPGKRFLAALQYQPVVLYRDITKTPKQAT